jgi:hypothetical protein
MTDKMELFSRDEDRESKSKNVDMTDKMELTNAELKLFVLSSLPVFKLEKKCLKLVS